jgi:tetratricopeptide (TPR) repeat protein
MLVSLGRLDEAAVEYRRVLDYDPNFTNALNNLAGIYLLTGRYLDSVPMFKRLLDLQPDDDTAASNLGTAYFYLDRLDEAIPAYEEAIRRAPRKPMHKTNLADALEKSGKTTQARQWYEKALPDYERMLAHGAEDQKALVFADRAYAVAKLGRHDEARSDARRALTLDPDDVAVLYSAARAHGVAGDRERALELTRRVIAAGYPREDIRRDVAFAAYRNDPGFLRTLEAELDR